MSAFARPGATSMEYLFAFLIHNREVFNTSRPHLASFYAIGLERIHQILFNLLSQYANTRGSVPDRAILECEYLSLVETSPTCGEHDLDNAKDLVNWLYDQVSPDEIIKNTEYGIELFKRFLQDQLRKRLQQQTQDAYLGQTDEDLPSIVKQISEKFAEIELLDKAPNGEIDPSRWIEQNQQERFLVGLPFWDAYTITYPGDVNVILGGTGVGKTTLALQILTYAARKDYFDNKENAGLFVYLGYEDKAAAASKRIISCAAKILRERLETIRSIDELSTKDNLQPYELEFFKNNPYAERRGERERYLAAMTFIKPTIRVFDCSGLSRDGGKALGNGGISEIRALLDRLCQSQEKRLKMLVIDWAGMVVRRYLQTKNRFNEKAIVLELETFVDRIYQDIALPTGAVVYVVHQLRGQVAKQAPTTAVSHADAAWCSNFAVNAWNAIVFGPKDPETNAFTLSWTKTRRGVGKHNLVCIIDDKFSRIINDDHYYLDHVTRRILREEEPGYAKKTIKKTADY